MRDDGGQPAHGLEQRGPAGPEWGFTVFGPLPRIYRIIVVAGALVLSVAGGAWLAHSLALPLPFRGLLVGAAVGALVAFVLIHDFSPRRQPGAVRADRRR